jgi:hypothetical protein
MPFGQIIKQFWKQILVFGAAFAAGTVLAARDLDALESGAVESVRVWAPVASFYERFGYWPAVLLLPTVGLLCGGVICWKLMKHGKLRP